MTLSPQTLGEKIWQLLGVQRGDELVISRDKITGGLLISKEGGTQ